jgi:tetratricopeptide (TPR) repeat protein
MARREVKSEQSPTAAFVVAASLCGIITLTRFVASFFTSERLWGLSHLGYYSLPVRVGVTLAALAILVPVVNRSVRGVLKVILNWVDGKLLNKPLGLAGLGVSAWVIFYLLRQKTHFLGDGLGLLRSLELDRLPRWFAEPVGILVPYAIDRIFSPLHITPEFSYAIVSCSAGVAFLGLAYLWGKAVAQEDFLGRWLVFGLLATLGVVQQFFGYVENYSLLIVVQMAFFLLGYLALEGRASLLWPTLLLIALPLFHLTCLLFIPSWFVLWVGTKKELPKAKKAWTFIFGTGGTLLLIAFAVLRVGEPGKLTRYAIPFARGTDWSPGYSLLSWPHLLDLFNLHNLASPVVFPLLFVMFISLGNLKADKKKIWFFLVAILAQIGFTTLFDPAIGAVRDWDLLSATGAIGYALLLTYLVVLAPFKWRGYLGSTLVWTSLFATASFIGVNASKPRSLQRIQDGALLDPLRDRGYSVLSVVTYFGELKRKPEMMAFIRKADERAEQFLVEDPENTTVHYLRGALLIGPGLAPNSEEIARAQREFLFVIERDPKIGVAWYMLAGSYETQGRLWDAIFCYERVVALNPKHVRGWEGLSRLYLTTGQMEEAIRCLEKMVRFLPQRSDLWSSLGVVLEVQKDYAGAELAHRRAIRLNPNEALNHFNLASTLIHQGKWNDTVLECRQAIRLDPKLAPAYSNLGLALIRLGQYAEAEETLRGGLSIAQNQPELHYNLSLALQGLGKVEDAQKEYDTFQRLNREQQQGDDNR